jgi:hypothetical protein
MGGSGLAAHMSQAVDSRLAGKSAASALAVFTTLVHADIGPFERNDSFWAADQVAGLTCVSPSREGGSTACLGAAVTPRHVLYHKHGDLIPNGNTMRFVDALDNIVLRTQDQAVETAIPDFSVGLLSSDLPASIPFCKVAPDDLRNYLQAWQRAPIMVLDQEGKGLVYDVTNIDAQFVYVSVPTDSQRLAFHETLIANDSGKAWFGIVNDEPVLFAITQGNISGLGETMGATPAGWSSVLNAAIAAVDALGAVSTGYTVTPASFSGFAKVR